MKFSTLSLVFVLIFSTSCSLFVDEYQVNSRKVIAYLLEDLPLPDDADIIFSKSIDTKWWKKPISLFFGKTTTTIS